MAWTFINFDIVAKRAPQFWNSLLSVHIKRGLCLRHINQISFEQTNSLKVSRQIVQMKVTMKMATLLLNISSTNLMAQSNSSPWALLEWISYHLLALAAKQTWNARNELLGVKDDFIYVFTITNTIFWQRHKWRPLHYSRPAIYIYVIRRTSSTWIAPLDKKKYGAASASTATTEIRTIHTHRIQTRFITLHSDVRQLRIRLKQVSCVRRHILHVLLFIVVIDSILTKTNLNAEWMTLSANS